MFRWLIQKMSEMMTMYYHQVRSARADLPVGPEKYNEEPHRGHQEGQNHREGGEME